MRIVALKGMPCLLLVALSIAVVTFPKSLIVSADTVPRVIYVDGGGLGDFTTIQAAINNATDHSIIYVYSGVYHENVVVNKSVSVLGQRAPNATTLVSGGSQGHTFRVVADNVCISNFTIIGSGGENSGVYLDYSYRCNVTNSIITGSRGITLSLSSNNIIFGNNISDCAFSGIELVASSGNTIGNNTIRSSVQKGLYLSSSSGNVISGNDIQLNNSFLGILVQYSHDNVISDNIISGSVYDGLSFSMSNHSIVSGNDMFDNANGIHLESSHDSVIYRNNFANTQNALIGTQGTVNAWDYLGEGNHWNDYTGRDVSDDGVGDTPYNISRPGGVDQDRCPLMGPYSRYILSFAGSTYDSYVITNSTLSSFRLELGQETANKIIRFVANGQSGSIGFCRIAIPNGLMPSPHIVLVDSKEVIPRILNSSDEAHVRLYFTYLHKGQTVTIIYSESLHLYYSLFESYLALQLNLTTLQSDYGALNTTYFDLLDDFGQAQQSLAALNASYAELSRLNSQLQANYSVMQATYNGLLATFSQLQTSFTALNASYAMLAALNYSQYGLLRNYGLLVANYTLLNDRFAELNASYQISLQDYSKQAQNLRNLLYIFAATTTLFIVTTIYLSKRVHSSKSARARSA